MLGQCFLAFASHLLREMLEGIYRRGTVELERVERERKKRGEEEERDGRREERQKREMEDIYTQPGSHLQ